MANGVEVGAGSLAVGVAANTERLEQQLDREIPEKARRGGEKAGQAFGEGLSGPVAQKGREAARLVLDRLGSEFQSRARRVAEQLAQGLITPQQAEQAGTDAGQALQRGLQQALERVRGTPGFAAFRQELLRGLQGPEFENFRRQVSTQMEGAGTEGGRSFGDALSRSAARGNLGERIVSGLRTELDQSMGRIREDLLRGILDPQEAERQARIAGQRFQRGLLDELQRLRAAGRLTPEIAERLQRELRTAGEQAGRVFGTSVDRGARSGLESINRFVRGAWRAGIVGAVIIVGRAMVRAFRRVARQIREALQRAGEIQAIRRAFEQLATARGLDPTDLLRQLQEAARGTASAFDLMRGANEAMQAGLPGTSEQLAEMLELSRRLGKSLGTDSEESFRRFVTAVVRGRRQILDDIGVVVDFGAAHEAFAKKVGVSVESLTEEQKAAARLEGALEVARRRVDDLGNETFTAAERLQQMETATRNVVDAILLGIAESPRFTRVLETLANQALDTADALDLITINVAAFVDTIITLATDGRVVAAFGSLAVGPALFADAIRALAGEEPIFVKALGRMTGATETFIDAQEEARQRVDDLQRASDIRRAQAIEDLTPIAAAIREDVAAANAEVADLEAKLDELEQTRERAADRGTLARFFVPGAEQEVVQAEEQIEATRERLQAARERRQERLAELQKQVNALAARETAIKAGTLDTETRTTEELRTQAEILEELKALLAETVPTALTGESAGLQRIRETLASLRQEAQVLRDLADLRPLTQAEQKRLDMLQQLIAGIEEAEGLTLELAEATGKTVVLLEDGTVQIVTNEEATRRWKEETEDLADTLDTIRDRIQEIRSVVSGLTRGLQEMGAIGERAAEAINSAFQAAAGASTIAVGLANPKKLLGALQVAAGGADIVQAIAGIAGPTARTQELRELREALDKLRVSVDQLAQTFVGLPGALVGRLEAGLEAAGRLFREREGVGLVEGGLDRFKDIPAGTEEDAARLFLSFVDGVDDLRDAERAFGLELDDLIQFFETGKAKGDELGNELGALADAMEQARDATREFFLESVEGRRQLLGIEEALFDLPTDVVLEKTRELFLDLAKLPDEVEGAFRDLDLGTAEGRAEAEALIQSLFDRFRAGAITAAQMGELSTTEFLDFLRDMEATLDQLDETLGAEPGEEGGFRAVGVFTGATSGQMDRLLGIEQTILAFVARHLPSIDEALRRVLLGLGGSIEGLDVLGQLPPAPAPTVDLDATDPETRAVLERIEALLAPPLDVRVVEGATDAPSDAEAVQNFRVEERVVTPELAPSFELSPTFSVAGPETTDQLARIVSLLSQPLMVEVVGGLPPRAPLSAERFAPVPNGDGGGGGDIHIASLSVPVQQIGPVHVDGSRITDVQSFERNLGASTGAPLSRQLETEIRRRLLNRGVPQ